MADQNFKSLATRFVLSDDDAEKTQCAAAAANALEIAASSRVALAEWAASIDTWMPGRSNDAAEDRETESDVIARANALSFLAKTLEFTKVDLMKISQIELLIGFFGVLFSADHKAGISAATKALSHLSNMKHFKPQMGNSILRHIVQLREDFSRQEAATRFEIYQLVDRLMGGSGGLDNAQANLEDPNQTMKDLLQLCGNERDPKNLIKWFGILEGYLKANFATPELAKEVFAAYSAYFPISMRSSTSSSGVTVVDLKTALRNGFKACHLAAADVFDFLIKKLDQGDGGVSVTVKVDVLDTISACIQGFPDTQTNVMPHTHKVWDSIKYEIRHGEVDEAINAALKTVAAIAKSIDEDQSSKQLFPVAALEKFLLEVLQWCQMDLASTKYLNSAIVTLASVSGATPRAFALLVDRMVSEVSRNLLQSGRQVQQGIEFFNLMLRNRRTLIETYPSAHPGIEQLRQHDTLVYGLLDKYFKVWNETRTAAESMELKESSGIYKVTMRGLAELVRQTKESESLKSIPLLESNDRQHIVDLLAGEVIPEFHVRDWPGFDEEVAVAAAEALREISSVDPDAYHRLVGQALAGVFDLPGAERPQDGGLSTDGVKAWNTSAEEEHKHDNLQTMLKRLAFIGCSTITVDNNPLHNAAMLLEYLTNTLLSCINHGGLPELLHDLLVGIYAALLHMNSNPAVLGVGELTVDEKTAFWKSIHGFLTDGVSITPASGGAQFSFSDLSFLVAAGEQRYLRVQAQALGLFVLNLLTPQAPMFTKDKEIMNVLLWEQCLATLSRIISYVTRQMDEVGQLGTELYRNIDLDGDDVRGIFNKSWGGIKLEIVTLGYLQGLWPNVLVRLADLGFSPQMLLGGFDEMRFVDQDVLQNRDRMAMILANKLMAGSAISDTQRQSWAATMETIKATLGPAFAGKNAFRVFTRLVHIVAGAIARLDPDAKKIAPLLLDAAVRKGGSERMARSLDRLVMVGDVLNAHTHAVTRKLHQQMVYGCVVSPNLSRAFPTAADSEEARRVAVAILAMLRYMPANIYGDDVDQIVRVSIAALGDLTATPLPDPYDVALALHVLNQVAKADPAALKGHLKRIIETSASIIQFQDDWGSTSIQTGIDKNLGFDRYTRKLAVDLVCQLPNCYQQQLGLLLPHKPLVTRVLGVASGDRVREIREIVNQGREDWEQIS